MVYLLDDEVQRLNPLALHLSANGYNCHIYDSENDLLTELPEDPPHMLFIHGGEDQQRTAQLITQILRMIPELHIFYLNSAENMVSASHFYDLGVYECITYPAPSFDFILRACDRAAERDYYFYLNEQLLENAQSMPKGFIEAPEDESSSSTDFSTFDRWLRDLYQCSSLKAAVDHYLREVSRLLHPSPVLYFKFLPTQKTLVATQGLGLPTEKWQGIGVQLEGSILQAAKQMEKPQEVSEINEMIEQVFDVKNYTLVALPLTDGIKGLFAILGHSMENHPSKDYFNACTQALLQVGERLNLERRFHNVNITDTQTNALSRAEWSRRLNEEISRSRRTQSPVSLVVLSIDEWENETDDEFIAIIKSLTGIVRKNSRVNDILGRVGARELGLILPHTHHKGAAIKAERLRRIVESADFSKILGRSLRVTLSLGVSEYPSLCQDAEELLQTADEALYQVKKTSHNKVCLATAKMGFVPDFTVDTRA